MVKRIPKSSPGANSDSGAESGVGFAKCIFHTSFNDCWDPRAQVALEAASSEGPLSFSLTRQFMESHVAQTPPAPGEDLGILFTT